MFGQPPVGYLERVFLPVGVQQVDVQRLVLLREGENKLVAGKLIRRLFYHLDKPLIQPGIEFKFKRHILPHYRREPRSVIISMS